MSTYTKTSLIIDSVLYTIFIIICLSYIKLLFFDTIRPERGIDVTFVTIFAYALSAMFVFSNSLQGIIFQKNKLVAKQNIYGLISIPIMGILIYTLTQFNIDYFLSSLPHFSDLDLFRKNYTIQLTLLVIFNVFNLFNSRRIFELSNKTDKNGTMVNLP